MNYQLRLNRIRTSRARLAEWAVTSAVVLSGLLFPRFAFTDDSDCSEIKIEAARPVDNERFGPAIAISGDVLLAGSSELSNVPFSHYGSARVYRLGETGIVEEQSLTPSDSAELSPDADFGLAVAVSGDVALVGAPHASSLLLEYPGAVYLFRHDGSEWVEEQKLVASDGGNGDLFGVEVDVSGDVAVVASAYNDLEETRVYVFRYDGSEWVEEDVLGPTSGIFNDVAVSGDFLFVGSREDDEAAEQAGAVFVFRFDGREWVEEQKLMVPGAGAGQLIGTAIDVSGDVAVIGNHLNGDYTYYTGAAYVFRWDGSQWVEEQKLIASDESDDDDFGFAVAVSSNVIAIGAPHTLPGEEDLSGSAYLFRYNGENWLEDEKLLPSDGYDQDFFGITVCIEGEVVVVGGDFDTTGSLAPPTGAAYVYSCFPDCNGNRMDDVAEIASGESSDCNEDGIPDGCQRGSVERTSVGGGESEATFGDALAVDGDIALLGARGYDAAGVNSGAVFALRRGVSQWSEVQQLDAGDLAAGDDFGHAVALDGDIAFVGARHHDDLGSNAGAVYVYGFDSGTEQWVEVQKLTGSDTEAGDEFGHSVTVRGDWALIGARLDDDGGSGAGSAYLFHFDGIEWVEHQKLTAGDSAAGDNFGSAAALAEGVALIGATGDDEIASNAGTAYVFRQVGDEWREEGKLLASDGSANDSLGNVVALGCDFAVVAASAEDGVASNSGSVHLYRRDEEEWNEAQILTASDASIDALFGVSLALNGDLLAIGASKATTSQPGQVYVFHHDEVLATWNEILRFTSLSTWDSYFGSSVGIDGVRVLASAHVDASLVGTVGSLYSYEVQDCNGNGELDSCDIAEGVEEDLDHDEVPDSCQIAPTCEPFIPTPEFLRGDVNGDGVVRGISDTIALLSYSLLEGAVPRCMEAADVDGNGTVRGVNDALYLLNYSFERGPFPPAPFPACGGAEIHTSCETPISCP